MEDRGRPWGRRAGAVLMGTVVLALAATGTAAGQDSLAPPGASPHYLPKEDWVYRHWIPFDEQTLKQALGLHGRDLEAYLYDDHRSLAQLATGRGLTVDGLVDTLLQPWAGSVDAGRMAVLRDHATRLITQPHLAQHILFHVYHGTDARGAAPQIFGLSPRAYWRMRLRGRTPAQAAKAGGVTAAHAEAGLEALFRIDHDEGVRLQVALPSEADRIQARQVRQLPCWMTRPLPSKDPSSPYAHEMDMHGEHYEDSPMTAAEHREDERDVERFRRNLPPSCWDRPPAWSWPAHGLAGP